MPAIPTNYDEYKDKIADYLGALEGKGVAKIVDIAKGVGLKRRECSKVINQMEIDGIIQPAGVAPGVAGYKLKK